MLRFLAIFLSIILTMEWSYCARSAKWSNCMSLTRTDRCIFGLNIVVWPKVENFRHKIQMKFQWMFSSYLALADNALNDVSYVCYWVNCDSYMIRGHINDVNILTTDELFVASNPNIRKHVEEETQNRIPSARCSFQFAFRRENCYRELKERDKNRANT